MWGHLPPTVGHVAEVARKLRGGRCADSCGGKGRRGGRLNIEGRCGEWAGDLAPEAGEAAGLGLPLRLFEDEDEEEEAEDILRRART